MAVVSAGCGGAAAWFLGWDPWFGAAPLGVFVSFVFAFVIGAVARFRHRERSRARIAMRPPVIAGLTLLWLAPVVCLLLQRWLGPLAMVFWYPGSGVAFLVWLLLGYRLALALRYMIHGERLARRAPHNGVVFLRPFDTDDHLVQEGERAPGLHRFAGVVFGRSASILLRDLEREEDRNFDRYLQESFERALGPLVALGNPRRWLPDGGARKLFATDRAWKQDVARLIDESACVIVRVGDSAGLTWELKHLRDRADPTTVFLVTEPDTDGTLWGLERDNWPAMREQFGNAGWSVPEAFPVSGTVIGFGADGAPRVLAAGLSRPSDYVAAVIAGLEGHDSLDRAAAELRDEEREQARGDRVRDALWVAWGIAGAALLWLVVHGWVFLGFRDLEPYYLQEYMEPQFRLAWVVVPLLLLGIGGLGPVLRVARASPALAISCRFFAMLLAAVFASDALRSLLPYPSNVLDSPETSVMRIGFRLEPFVVEAVLVALLAETAARVLGRVGDSRGRTAARWVSVLGPLVFAFIAVTPYLLDDFRNRWVALIMMCPTVVWLALVVLFVRVSRRVAGASGMRPPRGYAWHAAIIVAVMLVHDYTTSVRHLPWSSERPDPVVASEPAVVPPDADADELYDMTDAPVDDPEELGVPVEQGNEASASGLVQVYDARGISVPAAQELVDPYADDYLECYEDLSNRQPGAIGSVVVVAVSDGEGEVDVRDVVIGSDAVGMDDDFAFCVEWVLQMEYFDPELTIEMELSFPPPGDQRSMR